MGICATVRNLAICLRETEFPFTQRQKLQLEILKLGPNYLEIMNLPAWESAFQDTMLDDDDLSEQGILISEIYELGMFNMYGAFQVNETKKYADKVVKALIDKGVKVNENELEFEKW